MKIKINGENYTYQHKDCSLSKVLVGGIAVAINGSLIRKSDWKNTQVEDGDELEVLTATQGG